MANMNPSQTVAYELQKMIDRFSDEQLESLKHYADILEKAFAHPRGPEGRVIQGFMHMERQITGDRTMEMRLPIRWEMYNGMGILHGGVLATFVDNAMGRTLHTLYPGTITRQVTLDMNIRYLRGADGKELVARTELIQAGKSVAVLGCTVYNDRDEPIVSASATFRVYTASQK
jgi:uncharacterized protein (TIGR00369 family)